ncbi:MAG: leucyl/phenylalanyl-tRNA--protein transferase [Saprospiraceae bacterium]|nr:leucyl/phenylalanyl-tRNA--protein transferase [Pyrinomonadaceae bacterium]
MSEFPNPRTHEFPAWVLAGEYFYDGRDIVSLGNELTVENVRDAYLSGIFPWHIDGMPLPWYCPARRAILEFTEVDIPRSLEKERRKSKFSFTIDKAFREVMENCSKVKRPGQGGTWITPEFIEVYTELHKQGMAHSVEAWDESGELAGGLYGIDSGGVFCGESMFHKASNTSKLALLFLIDRLRERGSTWLDAQVMTPHMETLGAKEIKRSDFLIKLKETQELKSALF